MPSLLSQGMFSREPAKSSHVLLLPVDRSFYEPARWCCRRSCYATGSWEYRTPTEGSAPKAWGRPRTTSAGRSRIRGGPQMVPRSRSSRLRGATTALQA
jgi:hypothetical protein